MHMKKCSASALGAEGRRFESCHPDRKWDSCESSCFFLLSWFLGEIGGFRQPERQPEFSMNASVSVVCYKSKVLSNGKSPLMLRVTKDRKPKYVSLGIFASILKNTGVNIALISQALGHQDIKTTEIYLSKFDDKQMDEIMSNLL